MYQRDIHKTKRIDFRAFFHPDVGPGKRRRGGAGSAGIEPQKGVAGRILFLFHS
jgi:hypothetical protein